ncbi:hypothetical protein SeMB42_g03565 [Synchytrium endobioticum]|uniref:Secreted protein n=1 Tax=Synchytrium endobioticum TaxID=286115 RepID=A0A507CPL9_9FUNG|nr:hypothetical protein SeLEV6574_g06260 [Synchytrium endobioticum]TPX46755.1 hypothetical protein SeMB42_g03565 [Synchytrium endobioticum]
MSLSTAKGPASFTALLILVLASTIISHSDAQGTWSAATVSTGCADGSKTHYVQALNLPCNKTVACQPNKNVTGLFVTGTCGNDPDAIATTAFGTSPVFAFHYFADSGCTDFIASEYYLSDGTCLPSPDGLPLSVQLSVAADGAVSINGYNSSATCTGAFMTSNMNKTAFGNCVASPDGTSQKMYASIPSGATAGATPAGGTTGTGAGNTTGTGAGNTTGQAKAASWKPAPSLTTIVLSVCLALGASVSVSS